MKRFKEEEEDLAWIRFRKAFRRRRARGEDIKEYTLDWEQLLDEALAHDGLEITDTLEAFLYIDSLGIKGQDISPTLHEDEEMAPSPA